ncbi:NAD(P)/FAD-dependent oxidoreductase [Apibacter raozihei]|uniref:NAD(P)/FAD-dependent oxidoreductase n=1 Tax=Apibacter raozihei TaxID=2500547 RepID=UPI000FE2E933|nr:NAD(P)/FAD-dependent oxidoreductase [Apibacter raozihei]
MKKETVDVLIIGAGPSGAVSAGILAKNGINFKIVDKERFPRFVIGESLLPRSMEHFEEAGLLDDLMKYGFEKKIGARFLRGEDVCWFKFNDKFTDGWDWTWQIPRAEFDKAITDSLESKGIKIDFETKVESITFNGSESLSVISDAQGNKTEVHAKFIIDASGYGRVLPEIENLEAPSVLAPKTSMFVHVKDSNKPEGIEGPTITFDVLELEHWFWMIPFSNGITSLGLVAPSDYFPKNDSYDKESFFRDIIRRSSYYKDRFEDVEFVFEPKQIIGYSKSVKKLYGNGYVLTGNSSEFLDPVFSSGVCFATESGSLAAKLISKQLKGDVVDWEKEYSEYIAWGVDVFRSYIQDWYSGDLQEFFFHKEENPEVRRKVCSVLAGYVWDKNNPFVSKHNRAVKAIANMIREGKNS